MKKVTEETSAGKSEARPSGLDDLIQQGARQIIQQAIEAELTTLLERYDNVKTLDGRRAVIRNGYLPEREVVTAIGPVTVQVPKVRDRSGSGVKFNSNIVPPYIRKSPRVSAALPWLYLRGVSTGDMSEALSVLLGEEAKGLSPNVVSRLKAQWAEEHVLWNRRDLSDSRWVYWWADGIHTGLRSDDSDGQCLLVIIGVKPDGTKRTCGDWRRLPRVEGRLVRALAGSESARPAKWSAARDRRRGDGSVGGIGRSVSKDPAPALLVP